LAFEGVKLFSLQKDYRPRKYHDSEDVIDLCSDGPAVVDLSPMLNNFDDTASFVAGMDLVISVDTAVMHLSAAMGKETWGLIPYNPDWRWGLYGSDTPLYSNLKLFRQTQKNDWRSVMGAVGAKLREKLSPR
jgi:ADP-heptose:LPS heptosyltransferase